MGEIGVIDTGVLIGFTIKNDQHHETTKEYILHRGPGNLYLPPRAKEEFDNRESYIRSSLREEIISHRQAVSSNFDSNKISQSGFQYIRDQILDESRQERAHDFLYRWYTDFYEQNVSLEKSTVIRMLSNMETEVLEDRSLEWGGWRSHVSQWTRGIDPYPDIQATLLLSDQPDLDILLEAHHIATEHNPKQVEFATANPWDFVYENDGEPRSREDDIINVTNLYHIENLCNQLDRHFP